MFFAFFFYDIQPQVCVYYDAWENDNDEDPVMSLVYTIFSVNTKELHHTIKKHYGNDFDGSRYLERFFDFPVSLPPPNLEKFYQCLNFNKSYYEYDIVCEAVVKTFHLELREIAKFFRLAKIAAYDVTHGKQKLSVWDGQALEFCIILFVPIMLGLRICNTPRYMDFIQGRDCNPLLEVVENLDMFGYGKLLAGNETYDNNDVTKKLVTVEEKLKSVYNALFVHVYNENERRVNIGTFTFDRGTKDFLLWITGLLSKYTNPYLD